jgi:hypothetical protein
VFGTRVYYFAYALFECQHAGTDEISGKSTEIVACRPLSLWFVVRVWRMLTN